MQLGFGLITCQRYPGDPRHDRQLYHDGLELAEQAERLGFDSVWVSEHHFLDDAYMPSLLPVLAAIAARTHRVLVGTALLLAPLYHPLRLAEDAAAVDLLAGGRLVLGLGQGWREEEFDVLAVPLAGRPGRLEHAVTTLRQAWAGEAVVGSDLERYPGVAITPQPARPGGPPIWIGANSARAIGRAGRIGDGFMAPEGTPEALKEQVKWARDAAERAGRDPEALQISMYMPTFAWHGDDVWERVRPHHHYVTWKYEDMGPARGRRGLPPPPPPLTAADEEELRRRIVLGTPEQVTEQLRAFDEAADGPLHYIARLYWPGMDRAVQDEAMRIFAEEVAPALR